MQITLLPSFLEDSFRRCPEGTRKFLLKFLEEDAGLGQGQGEPEAINETECKSGIDKGVAETADKCWLRPRTVFMFVCLLVCSAVVAVQLIQCFEKLQHPPITTHTKMEQRDNLLLPAVTACRVPAFKKHVLQKYNLKNGVTTTSDWQNFTYSNVSLHVLWEESTYTRDESIVLQFSGLSGSNKSIKLEESMHLNSGRCFTVKPLNETTIAGKKYGYSLRFRHNYDSGSTTDQWGFRGWQIYIHDKNETYSDNPYNVIGRQENFYLHIRETLDIKLKLNHYELVSHHDQACVTAEPYSYSQCLDSCRWKKITNDIHCKGPWMDGVKLPDCNNYTQVKEILGRTVQYDKHTEHCKCFRPCSIYQYTSYVVDRTSNFKGNTSHLFIHFDSMFVQQQTEVWSYNFSQFVADAGGSMGFLLGMSVVGIVTIVESMFEASCNQKRKKESQEAKEKPEEY